VQCRQRPARSSWEEPIKRLIGVIERILGHEGSPGYAPTTPRLRPRGDDPRVEEGAAALRESVGRVLRLP
jgi:hypothetical protein